MAASRDNDDSALAQFAEELRAARGKAGLSRDELGAELNYSGSLIGMIESMGRSPSLDFARGCDQLFNMPGTFERMQVRLRAEPLPEWFRPFAIHEAAATALYNFQLAIVPGLLQTAGYARALLSKRMGVGDEESERLVRARLERQAILDRAAPPPPMFWAVIDESVLRRPVGGPEVMRAQVEHLIEMAARPRIMIQVIPQPVGVHEGLNGSFVIAESAAELSIVYLETAMTGITVERPEHVAVIRLAYETLRAEALSPAASLSLMEELAKIWI
jgi:transcriptional regulator with XRE-family HTH domain